MKNLKKHCEHELSRLGAHDSPELLRRPDALTTNWSFWITTDTSP